MKWNRKYAILLVVSVLTLSLDQMTKLWVHGTLQIGQRISVVSGFLDIHYIRNTGAAFGFLSGAHLSFRIPFFIGISIVAIAIIMYLFMKMDDAVKLAPFSLSLVMGGAIGNLIDRIRLGEVIDFILFHYKWFSWPAFNVADVSITAGVVLLMYQILLPRKRAKVPFLFC